MSDPKNYTISRSNDSDSVSSDSLTSQTKLGAFAAYQHTCLSSLTSTLLAQIDAQHRSRPSLTDIDIYLLWLAFESSKSIKSRFADKLATKKRDSYFSRYSSITFFRADGQCKSPLQLDVPVDIYRMRKWSAFYALIYFECKSWHIESSHIIIVKARYNWLGFSQWSICNRVDILACVSLD